ncbi:unnamed protein product [Polarella glacialis]|uniref:Ion transport domain-containing protein n=1 Tax=Polarella glacialis TaxID=89957 RepID=A0A813FHK0_POLGL|nr:unnamed protein product [Polarella glacialis]
MTAHVAPVAAVNQIYRFGQGRPSSQGRHHLQTTTTTSTTTTTTTATATTTATTTPKQTFTKQVLDALADICKGQEDLARGQRQLEQRMGNLEKKLTAGGPTGLLAEKRVSPSAKGSFDRRVSSSGARFSFSAQPAQPAIGRPAMRFAIAVSEIPAGDNEDNDDTSRPIITRKKIVVPKPLEEADDSDEGGLSDCTDSSEEFEQHWNEKIQCRRTDVIKRVARHTMVNRKAMSDVEISPEWDMLVLTEHESRSQMFFSLDPNSRIRMAVDIVSLLMVLHDMIAIPWMMAWDIDLQTGIRQSFLATTLYWTADIVFSSFTGFYHDGIIERRLALISRKYVKGWFFMDLLMVVSDWVSFAATELSDGTDASTTTGLKLVRFLKLAKFLRILGLMRMIRFSKLFEELLDRSLAGGFRVVFDFVKLLCFVLWLSHVTTCLWFLLGMTGPSDTDSRWFDSVMMRSGDHFEAAAQGYQYATSFHFALSQITANGVEMLSPLNSIERWFNIVCLIFGLFFSSHVVSTFSSAMMQLEMANEDKTHKLKQLNTFLSQYPVDKGVARRCQR